MCKKLCFFAFVLCLFCVFALSVPHAEASPLTVRFFDVGQGDAVLLQTSEGNVLIDAGTEQSQTLLCMRLEQLGVKSLKLAVFTHLDEDHIGGADAVLRNFPTEQVWIPNAEAETESARRVLLAAEQTNTPIFRVYTGETYQQGDLFLTVLYPFTKYPTSGNEGSLVLRMQFGTRAALFMGDVGVAQEELLLQRYSASTLCVDLCKLGHHGADTSSSKAFLESIKPQYAVITCSSVNVYSHPSGEVLARLEALNTATFCTGWDGELVFESDGEVLYPVLNQ